MWTARPPDVSDAVLARCLALLPGEERDHVARFKFERNRREAIVTRALVRLSLARYVGRPAVSFRYRFGPFGRPDVDPPCGVVVNATNHPALVACAVSRISETGIDVEPTSRGDEILTVATTVFSPSELSALDELAPVARRDRAVTLWTCKEAYIKARGLGLSAPLQEIAVDFPSGTRPQLRLLTAGAVPGSWWLDTRDVHDCRIAVAVRSLQVLKLTVRAVDWDDVDFGLDVGA